MPSAHEQKNDQKIEAAREALRSVRGGMSLGLGRRLLSPDFD